MGRCWKEPCCLRNVAEGWVDHQLLGVHHDLSATWDLSFLLVGALLIAGGWVLQRSATPPVLPATPSDPHRGPSAGGDSNARQRRHPAPPRATPLRSRVTTVGCTGTPAAAGDSNGAADRSSRTPLV